MLQFWHILSSRLTPLKRPTSISDGKIPDLTLFENIPNLRLDYSVLIFCMHVYCHSLFLRTQYVHSENA